MNELGLFGGGFQHAYSSTWWKKPTYFSWAKNKVCDINCSVDERIVPDINSNTNTIKIAWLVESSVIITNTVNEVISNYKEVSESYDFLISHDKRVISLADNFFYLPPHGYWIENPMIYNKTKLCSMISSNKQLCDGHNFRLEWVDRLKTQVDLFGSGIRPFVKKEEALCDYMFSVTIENSSYETYWSEKILDCFTSGTIPIYHGSPDIDEFFNPDGIIKLTDDFKVEDLSKDLYISKMHAITDNLQRSLSYNVIEDIMWERFLSKYYE